MFLERVDNHPRCCLNYDPSHFLLQQLDYLEFIDIYHERITSLHIKDAEFRPDRPPGRVFGLPAVAAIAPGASARSATARSISARSSPRWPQYDYDGWAVLEWECALKHPEHGAAEGAEFIAEHIIRVTEKAFDDFAGAEQRPEAGPADARHLRARR